MPPLATRKLERTPPQGRSANLRPGQPGEGQWSRGRAAWCGSVLSRYFAVMVEGPLVPGGECRLRQRRGWGESLAPSLQALHWFVVDCVMARRLADVAKQAGVSEATVSRVLNGKPGISDATRARGAHRYSM